MGTASPWSRRRAGSWPFLILLAALTLGSTLPARAVSTLAAWRLSRDGVLELRTSPGIQIEAFYEAASNGKGPRVWVDLPGAPQRTRSIRASGALREVRIGKPQPSTTRLV